MRIPVPILVYAVGTLLYAIGVLVASAWLADTGGVVAAACAAWHVLRSPRRVSRLVRLALLAGLAFLAVDVVVKALPWYPPVPRRQAAFGYPMLPDVLAGQRTHARWVALWTLLCCACLALAAVGRYGRGRRAVVAVAAAVVSLVIIPPVLIGPVASSGVLDFLSTLAPTNTVLIAAFLLMLAGAGWLVARWRAGVRLRGRATAALFVIAGVALIAPVWSAISAATARLPGEVRADVTNAYSSTLLITSAGSTFTQVTSPGYRYAVVTRGPALGGAAQATGLLLGAACIVGACLRGPLEDHGAPPN